ANPRTCLRTIEIFGDPLQGRHHVAAGVMRSRAEMLGEREAAAKSSYGMPLRGDRSLLSRGRILAFFPDINLYHGLECGECGGYIDEYNNPPQDTWLGYFQWNSGLDGYWGGCLLAWVPLVFVEPVEMAISVSPEGCITWFDQCSHALSRM